MTQRTGPTNEKLNDLIRVLKKKASDDKAQLWKRIALDLEKSARGRRVVNLFRINQHTKENETIIVPGKVLGNGELNHKLVIAAFGFSSSAIEKINKVGKAITINELIEQKQKTSEIKIIG